MRSFEAGDVVRVPFPYTNRETKQHRPALVISDGSIGSGMLLWVLMITSRQNRAWRGDVPIDDEPTQSGLPAPSVVRTLKLATIETAVAERIGRVSNAVLAAVRAEVRTVLGLD